jgi:hypothetical protein
MPAAFAPLEDEAARAILDEHLEQRRRRHVQVGVDAVLLELGCLIRPAARDERKRRHELLMTRSCSSRSSLGTKPRMPTPHDRSPSSSWWR